jgi:hypothetical protein
VYTKLGQSVIQGFVGGIFPVRSNLESHVSSSSEGGIYDSECRRL